MQGCKMKEIVNYESLEISKGKTTYTLTCKRKKEVIQMEKRR